MRIRVAHLLLALAASSALAQTYPAKPLRVLTELAVGTTTENGVRIVAQQLGQQLGQPVVVENRPGGSGIVATEACSKAAADGYTLCTLVSSHAFNVHSFSSLPYHSERDFRPLSLLFYTIAVIGGAASLPANNVAEVRALAVAKPGALNFATIGAGTSTDIFRQLLGEQWKAEIVGVPYSGGIGQMIGSIMSGETQLSLMPLGGVAGAARAGKLKLLAVDSTQRLPQFPDVPTWNELGLQGVGRIFVGLGAPAGVPTAIVTRLADEIVRALREPKVVEGITGQVLEIGATPGAPEFERFLKDETDRIGGLFKRFNVPKVR